MKLHRQTLPLLLAAALLMNLSGCVTQTDGFVNARSSRQQDYVSGNVQKSSQRMHVSAQAEEADFAEFTANAKIWLAANPKPEMTNDARAYRVLAEDAFEQKDFPAALDAYCIALEKYPMWQKGQYNAAIMASYAQDYELAAHHMRRYLVLAPDAKDAAAAKDKLLLWQLKAKQ